VSRVTILSWKLLSVKRPAKLDSDRGFHYTEGKQVPALNGGALEVQAPTVVGEELQKGATNSAPTTLSDAREGGHLLF
jgi:hypothetical protein